MGKINLLDAQVANLIAAGEVVERPASAVKELMENAIDAAATRVTVEIQNGGVTLIRLTDNGSGMSREDALLCIRRHATSKIRVASDLDGISTLGFRGEALAAISSVSRMRIMTRRADEELGVVVECRAGTVTSVEESGCPLGTTIVVEELFANVPARRKFLKRDASEAAAVAAVVEKMALSRPDIAIKFISDGTLRFQTAGDGSLQNVIYAVLGREFAKKTVAVHDMTEGIEIEGVIGTPENVRGNRGGQNFFINGRYVRCGTASAALEQAFVSYIPSDKFPACVLSVTINPAFVDVNVHPQKMEVKFSSDKPVFNAVYCAVRNALMNRMERPDGQGFMGTRLTGDSARLYNDIMGMKTETEEEATRLSDEKERLQRKYEQITIPHEIKTVPPVDLSSDIPSVTPPKASSTASLDASSTATADTPSVASLLSMHAEGERTASPEEKSPRCEERTDRSEKSHEPLQESMKLVPPEMLVAVSGLSSELVPSEAPAREAMTDVKQVDAKEKDVLSSLIASDERRDGEPKDSFAVSTVESEASASDEYEKGEPQPTPWFRIAGVAFNCYVFVEMKDKMLIIDKHAAHERVLFERMRDNMRGLTPSGQLLMFPLDIPLTHEEGAAAEEYRAELEKMGFGFVAGEAARIALIQYPSGLNEAQAIELFTQLCSRLSSGEGTLDIGREQYYERALYQASCKAAVKAGREDTPENIAWIAEKVLTNPRVRYCPHGRPVAFEMTKGQFERQFERT